MDDGGVEDIEESTNKFILDGSLTLTYLILHCFLPKK